MVTVMRRMLKAVMITLVRMLVMLQSYATMMILMHRINVISPLLTETMKQFNSSVFDGSILEIISRVFDVRRDLLDKYFVSSSMFDDKFVPRLEFRLFVLKLYDFASLRCCLAGGVDLE